MTAHDLAGDVAGAPPHEERRLSVILAALVADSTRERIGIGELVAAMQDRAFGVLMFIFAIPNVLPTPPGVSSVLGAPLLLLSLQLTLGKPAPWLPKFIARRSLPAAEFGAVVKRVVPWIARAERLLKPRLGLLARPPAERLIGFVCLLLAIVLFLPIPLGNMLPALAISIFSLAILERDGVAVLIGYVLSAVSVFVVAGVVYALVVSAIFLLKNAVGWL
jgi:hypothetical protein